MTTPQAFVAGFASCALLLVPIAFLLARHWTDKRVQKLLKGMFPV